MSPALTRHALPGTTAAETAIPASDPDAELFDLIVRHAEANAALSAAEAEAERLLAVARAAYPARPPALLWREGDFPRTSFGLALSTPIACAEGEGRREYGQRAADYLRGRTAAAWFPSLSPPLGPECEARRAEIVAAFDAWTAEMAAVDDRVGWTDADGARAALGQAFWSLDDALRARRARTLAGLRARAAWMAERSAVSGLDETDGLVAFAREVAAFGGARA